MNVALSELPRFTCLPEPGDHLTAGIIMAPTLAYMDRAYLRRARHRLVARADRGNADPLDAGRQPRAEGPACRQPVLPARRAGTARRHGPGTIIATRSPT